MPDKLRPIILGLVEAGRTKEAQRLLHQEDAVWHALKEEAGDRIIAALIAENIACACGHCGVPTPREYIFGVLLQACGGGSVNEQEQRLQKLRYMLAMVESGSVEAIPSREEAIRQLQEEITAAEQGTSTMGGEPGALIVGQPFPSGEIPPGTVGLYPDAIPMMLVLGLDSPTTEDLAAFHTTEKYIEFALVPMGKLLITMVRFPTQKLTERAMWGYWCDTPWAHREDSWFDAGEVGGENERYGVSACLVDSDTNRVAGMRFFTLSPHYSRVYQRELAVRLAEPPITTEAFAQLSYEYQARYPEPKQMLDRAIARCKAGLP